MPEPRAIQTRPSAAGDFRPPLALLLMAAFVLLAGCKEPPLVEDYGSSTGRGRRSVAGTSALVAMYREAGFEVRTARSLGRHLDRAQVVVWTPDTYDLPGEEVCDYFDKWLSTRPGRTLVYVGRDYDAALDYWSGMAESLKGADRIKALRKKAQAAYEAEFARDTDIDQTHRWFVQKDAPVAQRVERLSAPAWSGWTRDIDASQARIRLRSTLSYPPPDEDDATALERAEYLSYMDDYSGEYGELFDEDAYGEDFGYEDDAYYDSFENYNAGFEKGYDESLVRLDPIVLLEADGRPMVSSAQWGGGENPSALVVVSNGSFLLNYPLTVPENRKLAGKLIDECGPPGIVYFLTSGPGEIEIRDPRAPKRTAWTMFTEWPLGIFMMHLTIAGLIICLAAFPIFGRARSYVTRDLQDFGYHLEAVGRLLERRKAYDFARQRLAAYSEWLRRETGSRRTPTAPGSGLDPVPRVEPPGG